MRICTFFGERKCPSGLDEEVYQAAEFLVKHRRIDTFLLAETGKFERLVRQALTRLKEAYPQIAWYVVPATLPEEASLTDTAYPVWIPENFIGLPKQYRTALRDDWLITKSACVICFNPSRRGIAAVYMQKAQQLGKEILYVGDSVPE